MKLTFVLLLLVIVITAGHLGPGALAQGNNNQDGGPVAQERTHMTRVLLGEDTKMTVLPSEREQLQRFYRDVLGCKVITKSKTFDLIQFGPNFYSGVVYDDSALSASQGLKAIWLELRVDDPQKVKENILKFGIREIEYWDKEHFYFQAPGGQVFRLVGSQEDMSKWQQ